MGGGREYEIVFQTSMVQIPETVVRSYLQKSKNVIRIIFLSFQEYEQQLKAYGIPVQPLDWKQVKFYEIWCEKPGR